MPSQGKMLLLYPMISSRRDLASVSLKHVYDFFFNKSQWRNYLKPNLKLNSPKEELNLPLFCHIGIIVQI